MPQEIDKISTDQMVAEITSGEIGEYCDLSRVEDFETKDLNEAAKVFQTIGQNSTIKKLNASKVINGWRSFSALTEALKGNQTINTLDISSEDDSFSLNHLRGASEKYLIDLLKQNTRITTLNIYLTAVQFQTIQEIFKNNKTITELGYTTIPESTIPFLKSGINEKQAPEIDKFLERNCLMELEDLEVKNAVTSNLQILPAAISDIVINYICLDAQRPISEGARKFQEVRGAEYVTNKLNSVEFKEMVMDFENNNQPSSSLKPEETQALKDFSSKIGSPKLGR